LISVASLAGGPRISADTLQQGALNDAEDELCMQGRGRASTPALRVLGAMIGLLRGVELPLVQFVPVNTAPSVSREVAYGFSVAAIEGFGRTLLLTMRGEEAAAPEFSLWGKLRKPEQRTDPLVPDPAIAGLYHRRVDAHAASAVRLGQGPISYWASGNQAFRMIVADCSPVGECPASLAFAVRAHASILVVLAGVTRPHDVRMAARQIRGAGGVVAGTILHGARHPDR